MESEKKFVASLLSRSTSIAAVDVEGMVAVEADEEEEGAIEGRIVETMAATKKKNWPSLPPMAPSSSSYFFRSSFCCLSQ